MSWATDAAADLEVERFVRERWVDWRGRDWLKRVNADAVYADYSSWHRGEPFARMSTRRFGQAMRRVGFDRPRGSRCWYGLGERGGDA